MEKHPTPPSTNLITPDNPTQTETEAVVEKKTFGDLTLGTMAGK